MNQFRLLNADEIECRIGSTTETGISLLLYKTARTDANLLDEVYTPVGWQNDFKVVDGVLYGGIGIYYPQMDDWIWKWDAGTESNTEAEKGRASDAFKRAGFKWGIGRELYTAPFIWIEGAGKKDRFTLTDIGYDNNGRINKLTIKNDKTNAVVYTYPKTKQAEAPKPEPKADPKPEAKTTTQAPAKPTCSICGEAITKDEYQFSNRFFNRPLCRNCQPKRR